MAQLETRAGVALPLRTDPIRIVPGHKVDDLVVISDTAFAGPPPELTYRGGRLPTSVEVFIVFWGRAWSTARNALATHVAGQTETVARFTMQKEWSNYANACV